MKKNAHTENESPMVFIDDLNSIFERGDYQDLHVSSPEYKTVRELVSWKSFFIVEGSAKDVINS